MKVTKLFLCMISILFISLMASYDKVGHSQLFLDSSEQIEYSAQVNELIPVFNVEAAYTESIGFSDSATRLKPSKIIAKKLINTFYLYMFDLQGDICINKINDIIRDKCLIDKLSEVADKYTYEVNFYLADDLRSILIC